MNLELSIIILWVFSIKKVFWNVLIFIILCVQHGITSLFVHTYMSSAKFVNNGMSRENSDKRYVLRQQNER